MSESQTPWGENNVFDWYFSEECNVTVGVPFSNNRALEIIGALGTISKRIEEGDTEEASALLDLFARMLIALGSQREDLIPELEEELLVRKFNNDFDSFIESLGEEE